MHTGGVRCRSWRLRAMGAGGGGPGGAEHGVAHEYEAWRLGRPVGRARGRDLVPQASGSCGMRQPGHVHRRWRDGARWVHEWLAEGAAAKGYKLCRRQAGDKPATREGQRGGIRVRKRNLTETWREEAIECPEWCSRTQAQQYQGGRGRRRTSMAGRTAEAQGPPGGRCGAPGCRLQIVAWALGVRHDRA